VQKRSSAAAKRAVVDRDVVLRKSEAIEHHTSRLRDKMPVQGAALEANESLLNDVCFDLLQAVQACIDLAVHACTHEALGVPSSPSTAFALLAKHHVVETSLADRLSRAAGLRNIIVHRYTDLAASKLADAINTGLADLDDFAAALRAHAGTGR
jgi:uncharacterized protein YutE (UPF0331/DUF86 family)